LPTEQINNGQIEINHVSIMSIRLGELFETFTTGSQLPIVEKVPWLGDAFGMS